MDEGAGKVLTGSPGVRSHCWSPGDWMGLSGKSWDFVD